MVMVAVAVTGAVPPVFAEVLNGKLSGTVNLDWASYRHEDGNGTVDGSHFFQSYSLLYSSKGVINSGRAGRWNVALGFEWNDLSSELADRDYDATTDKILYQGDILFAPGGLPLRVHAYSYDLHQTSPYASSRGDFGALIDPGIFTILNNGQHITTGITLLAGIKNGSYLGEYRELLSQFPKLLIDFQENLVRDTESSTPVHYRQRDLAFVSLNKKDNWFHYRHQDFEDYEDPASDYSQKTFLLGTVDHLERRQWINLTNWIKISTDVSLVKYEEPRDPRQNDETYNFNFFSMARRSSLDMSNFASFRRIKEVDEVESRIYFPVFANGFLDQQSAWRLMLIGEREKTEPFASGASDRSENTLYGRYQLETTRYAGYVFTPGAELESNKTTDEEGNAARLGFELRTNYNYNKPLDWLIDYDLTWVEGEGEDGESISSWGHDLLLSVNRRVDHRMTVGASQNLYVSSGDISQRPTSYITVRELSLDNDRFSDDSDIETSIGSRTTAYLELTGNRRLTNRFEALLIYEKEEYKKKDSLDEHLLELSHTLTSNMPKSILKMSSIFREGDDIEAETGTDGLAEPWGQLIDADKLFSHSTELTYRPNRAWETRGEANVEWMSGENEDAWVFSVEQETRYTLYQLGGRTRKILEAYQFFDYEQTWGAISSWYTKLELGVDWSPYRRFLVGGNVMLQYWDYSEQTEAGYELYAAVDFQKFRARTAYEYRQLDNDDDSSTPKVKDSRVSVSVQKIF